MWFCPASGVKHNIGRIFCLKQNLKFLFCNVTVNNSRTYPQRLSYTTLRAISFQRVAFFLWGAIAQRTLKKLCGWWRYVGFWGGAIIFVAEGLGLGFLRSTQPSLFTKGLDRLSKAVNNRDR
jgi:hypothetical protein